MKLFGYKIGKNANKPMALKEASIVCMPSELNKLINFLIDAEKELLPHVEQYEVCTLEILDWDKEWGRNNPALIVALVPEELKT